MLLSAAINGRVVHSGRRRGWAAADDINRSRSTAFSGGEACRSELNLCGGGGTGRQIVDCQVIDQPATVSTRGGGCVRGHPETYVDLAIRRSVFTARRKRFQRDAHMMQSPYAGIRAAALKRRAHH